MRYKNPTPNPLIACGEGAKMYLIRAETAVNLIVKYIFSIKNNQEDIEAMMEKAG
jgi:hypothetical protein